jgi:hypothetical protein
LTVLDVWDSEEALGRFAERLMPIVAAAGATPPPPEIRSVRNVIAGEPPALYTP